MTDQPTQLLCPELLRFEGGVPHLLGSRCTVCGERYFPATDACTACCATTAEACDLGSAGILWSWTIQGFPPKTPYDGPADPFEPYGVGYVEMPSGIKVEARLIADDLQQLRIGQRMALTVEAYRRDEQGQPVHPYAFRPQEARDGR